jgi:AAA15 family ATPase/GTPase
MIYRIGVTNFRSIKDKVELDLTATGLKGHDSNYFEVSEKKDLLKSAVLYGPNASGKSGLLRAFKAIEYLVINSANFKPGDKISPYEPHRLDSKHSKQPVSLEIEFATNNIKYEFFISYLEKSIDTEELFFYPNGVKSLLYSRIKGKDIKFGEAYKGGKKTIEKLTLENQLFLSKAAENNVETLQEPYKFFKEGIMVFPFLDAYHESSIGRLYAKKLAEDKNSGFKNKFNKLICALDTGITNIAAEEVNWKDYRFPDNMPEDVRKSFQEDYKYDIKAFHNLYEENKKVGEVAFEVSDESTGTQSLLVMAGIILDALEGGSTLVIDEFEKNLHPNITHYLIRLFHNPSTNRKNAQLIFSTHDITQLSAETFRRDQVWFTEKNELGATKLFRCSEIKGLRLGTPLDKWYATGRLGATPLINDSEFLMEMIEDGND